MLSTRGYALPPDHQTPASFLAPKAPQNIFAHWAPLSDDTKATRATFQQWVFTIPALLESSIPWAQATCTPDGRIAVAINSDRQLAILRDIGPLSQMVNPTFVRTLYLGNDLSSTIAFLHNESLALLVIVPVLNNVNITAITKELRAPPWLNGSTSTMQDWRSWVQFPWVTSTFNVDIA